MKTLTFITSKVLMLIALSFILFSLFTLVTGCTATRKPVLYEREWLYHAPYGEWKSTRWTVSTESTFERDTLLEIDNDFIIEFAYTNQFTLNQLNNLPE